tara:strand:- start:200 stop:367 length:168 start_codon:yes stop_codon:yes gene_type:complete
MKIKKIYQGLTIYKGRRKILLEEVTDSRTMEMLKNEFPYVLEPIKKKKNVVSAKD